MIEDWRAHWAYSNNFTFVVCQLAAYEAPTSVTTLREAQLSVSASSCCEHPVIPGTDAEKAWVRNMF
jgi:hypothetical protein